MVTLHVRRWGLGSELYRETADADLGLATVAIIDLLVPTYKTRARKSVKVGNLVTTEVGGLATALQRAATNVTLSMHTLNGDELSAVLPLPDEPSCFGLKAFAYGSRSSGKDAVDLWRCLEILHAAGSSKRLFSIATDSDQEVWVAMEKKRFEN